MFRSTHRDEIRLYGLKKWLCTASDSRQEMGGETGHASRPLSSASYIDREHSLIRNKNTEVVVRRSLAASATRSGYQGGFLLDSPDRAMERP
jgi:hypothetical protein